MFVLVIVVSGITLWCLASLPVAVAVGRAFQAGEIEEGLAEIVGDYDAAGV
jgi:hypothetical protein